jgi:hypothetical protein
MFSKANLSKFLVADNFLNLLYFLSFQIMKNKFFKAISVLVLLFHSVIHLIQIGHLVATFDRIFLVKYVPNNLYDLYNGESSHCIPPNPLSYIVHMFL